MRKSYYQRPTLHQLSNSFANSRFPISYTFVAGKRLFLSISFHQFSIPTKFYFPMSSQNNSLAGFSCFRERVNQGVQMMSSQAFKQKLNPSIQYLINVDKKPSSRTYRIYNEIVRHWLYRHNYIEISNKYSKHFSQKIFFILVLSEIVRLVDGNVFLRYFIKKVRKLKKSKQYLQKQNEVDQSPQVSILQLQYSILSCKEFIEGNMLNAVSLLYCKGSGNMNVQDFRESLKIFKDELGYIPEDM